MAELQELTLELIDQEPSPARTGRAVKSTASADDGDENPSSNGRWRRQAG